MTGLRSEHLLANIEIQQCATKDQISPISTFIR
jgi:hypothetical protein